AEFDKNFAWSFYRADGNDLRLATQMLGSVGQTISSGATTDELFWRDPFTTQFQNQARTNTDKIKQMRTTVENAEELLIRNASRARRNQTNLDALKFAARRFDHLGRR